MGALHGAMGSFNTICHRAHRNRGRDRSPPKISSQNAQLNGCAARRYAGSIIYHWAPFLWFALWLVDERMLAKNWKVKILDHLVLLRQACQRHRWVIEMLAKQTPALKAMYFHLLLLLLCIVWSFVSLHLCQTGPSAVVGVIGIKANSGKYRILIFCVCIREAGLGWVMEM